MRYDLTSKNGRIADCALVAALTQALTRRGSGPNFARGFTLINSVLRELHFESAATAAEQLQSDAALEVRLTYHGEDSGELIVSGPLGDMVLSATKDVVDQGGQNSTIGIRAFGNAYALMPDKAKLEQCIAKRLGKTLRPMIMTSTFRCSAARRLRRCA
jgi:hypothetical protein